MVSAAGPDHDNTAYTADEKGVVGDEKHISDPESPHPGEYGAEPREGDVQDFSEKKALK